MAKQKQNKGAWEPPRGIRLEFKKARPRRPWFVHYKGKAKGFVTEKEQIDYAKKLAAIKQSEQLIPNMPAFDPAKWIRFCQMERKVGGIEELEVAVESHVKSPKILGDKLFDLKEAFLEFKRREEIDEGTVTRYSTCLDMLEKSFPGYHVGEFTTEQLDNWVESMKYKKKPVTNLTKNNYRGYLVTLWKWLILQKQAKDNLAEGIPERKVIEKTVGILTVDEARKLFKTNRDEVLIGRLALEAFAGIRFSTAKKIQKREIHFEDRGIEIPAGIIKTEKRFYVDGFPKNLWAWLEHAPEACWKMTERKYQKAKERAFLRAKIEWPHNALRHSFGSYHVAAFGNVSKTATLLCHTNIRQLNRYYRGRARKADGLEYFEIRP